MRPVRFLLLLLLFVVLPIVLTCVSLFSSDRTNPEQLDVGYRSRTGRFRALFSFTTPSSFFPPSAIISLTDDNTTSFYARPAAFGPSLPSPGLSGQLWVGKGFGESTLVSEEVLRISGFELGCSDVPGWRIDHKLRMETGQNDGKAPKDPDEDPLMSTESIPKSVPSKRDTELVDDTDSPSAHNDGTDDHLHHPLPDSNPAFPEKPGEPASNVNHDKTKPPTHADIESLQESADIAGKIVMLSRGGCGFLEKVKWAQRRGGIAVIVGDNEPGGPLIVMYAKGDTSNITVPAIFTSYYSAQLLSTLVPPEEPRQIGNDGRPILFKDGKPKGREIFSDKKTPNARKPVSDDDQADDPAGNNNEKGWVRNVLSVVGLDDDTSVAGEDTRRPPGSGNIDWVLLEDWNDDKPAAPAAHTPTQKAAKTASMSTKLSKAQITSAKKAGNDDFIIGIQDWRDTELIAPKATATQGLGKQKVKPDVAVNQMSASPASAKSTKAALKGGSITPGSGEYNHDKEAPTGKDKQKKKDKSKTSTGHVASEDDRSFFERLASFFRGTHKEIVHPRPDEQFQRHEGLSREDHFGGDDPHRIKLHLGLWVTLTPSSTSSSPFFDTLLVLVVSPLVTLTFVYGLLLLRSRIRRRRWRAPKSVVERLPVRTYQTMSTTSSTTSSTMMTSDSSPPNVPNLRSTSQTQVRPRSQTTTGVISSSPPVEKKQNSPALRRKRYTGRQIECVVCLEEYVDGESQVMSLPCGHEFHVECITPWLVTRRRTCPICKGDVVRSLARNRSEVAGASDEAIESDEQTSDDVQERVATTANRDASAAIPIPVVDATTLDNDIERGSSVETPLLGTTPRAQQGRWRGIINGSISRLSGDTVWRSSAPSGNDRSR